jgi:hypothetical protein
LTVKNLIYGSEGSVHDKVAFQVRPEGDCKLPSLGLFSDFYEIVSTEDREGELHPSDPKPNRSDAVEF